MNLLITIMLTASMAKKVVIHDDQMDWQGANNALCELQKNTQLLQAQGSMNMTFHHQNFIIEGTLEMYVSTNQVVKIYIDNIQYGHEHIPYPNIIICSEAKSIIQQRIKFQGYSNSFNLRITSDEVVEIALVNVTLITCADNCLSCKRPDSCDQCAEGYISGLNKCVCEFFYEGKCYEQCPNNTRVLEGSYFCQNIENQTSIIGVEHLLSQQHFIFEQQQLIGPFQANHEIKGQFEIRPSIVAIAFELYLFNSSNEYVLNIDLNDVWFVMRQGSYNFNYDIDLISQRNCLNQQDCVIYQVQTFAIEQNSSQPFNISILVEDEKQIGRIGTHINDHPILEWAIRNLTILQLNKTAEAIVACATIINGTCQQCLGSTILYNNQCLEQCPEDTILLDENCILIPNYNKHSQILMYQGYDPDTNLGFLGEKQEFTNDKLRSVVIDGRTYFGGYWAENEFTEVYHLSKHYSLTISATLRIINSLNGYFYVKINGELKSQVFGEKITAPLENQSDVKMRFHFNHLDSQIMITTGCHDPDLGECYIREYAIVEHLCYPYCLECTGSQKQDCTKYSQKYKEFDYINQKCIDGYHFRERKCESCNVHNCLICDEFGRCSECQKGYYLKHWGCIQKD